MDTHQHDRSRSAATSVGRDSPPAVADCLLRPCPDPAPAYGRVDPFRSVCTPTVDAAAGPALRTRARRNSAGASIPALSGKRRGGRAVEGSGLENRQGGNSLVGSNPTPSARGLCFRRKIGSGPVFPLPLPRPRRRRFVVPSTRKPSQPRTAQGCFRFEGCKWRSSAEQKRHREASGTYWTNRHCVNGHLAPRSIIPVVALRAAPHSPPPPHSEDL
jgi:hypothetical protein